MGVEISAEAKESLVNAAGGCFAATFSLGAVYYLYLRWGSAH
jgi:hypothetical protein